MARNPFSPTFGATPRYLAEREPILAELEAGLDDGPGAPARTALFTGARGMGKTVMLNEFQDLARQRGWLVIAEDARDGLVERLSRNHMPRLLSEHADDAARLRLTSLGVGPVSVSGGVSARYPVEATLRSQTDILTDALAKNETGLLITVDEIHDAPRDDLRTLGHIMQHGRREGREIAFAGAGLPWSIDDLLDDKTLTFLQRAERFNLTNVSVEAAAGVLGQTAADADRPFTAQALDRASRESAGYPFTVQLIGHRSWIRSRDQDQITSEAVGQGVQDSRRRLGQQVHAPALRHLSTQDKTYLVAMSRDDGPSKTGEVAARLGVTPQHAGVYRARLIQHAIIRPAGHGRVDYTLPYLREFLRETAAHDALMKTIAPPSAER